MNFPPLSGATRREKAVPMTATTEAQPTVTSSLPDTHALSLEELSTFTAEAAEAMLARIADLPELSVRSAGFQSSI